MRQSKPTVIAGPVLLILLAACNSDGVAPVADAQRADLQSEQGAGDLAPVDQGAPDAAQCQVGPPPNPLTVRTERGLLRGTQRGGTVAFLGVPYAAPPVGQRRWAPPEPFPCWAGVREATQFGPRCPQQLLSYKGDEDCLFLNVWTPKVKGPDSTPLPVLFFVHGGANIIGAGNEGLATIVGTSAGGAANIYDGEGLAQKHNVVVVTMNYRLGRLGFLALPELAQESPHQTSGNYGLLDIIAALKWVQHNIGEMGGDADRVLLFGESAGASNTCMMLVSPLAKGLFQAALMESGGCDARPRAAREAEGDTLMQELGCASATDRLACMRAKPAREVTESLIGAFLNPSDPSLTWEFPWGPTIDGHVLLEEPMETLRKGEHHHVPLAIGTNAEEAELFVVRGSVNTCLDYTLHLKTIYGDNADKVKGHYRCLDYPRARWAAVDAMTDAIFTCPARRIVRAIAASQTEPTFRYQFSRSYSHGPLALLRSFHAGELMFVFQSFANIGYIPTAAETALSDAMQGYWSRLAGSGDPSGGGSVAWTRYEVSRDNYLALDTPIGMAESLKSDKCDFWDTLMP